MFKISISDALNSKMKIMNNMLIDRRLGFVAAGSKPTSHTYRVKAFIL